MVKVEGNQIIVELSEAEAKAATRVLPILGPMLAAFAKMYIRVLLEMALLGKDELMELLDKIEAGEEGVLQKVLPNVGALRTLLEKEFKDFPEREEIEKLLAPWD